MYKLILFLGICSAFALGSEQTKDSKHSKHSEKVVGCFYEMNEPLNDPQPALVKMGIDASLCNYLIYSFVGVGPNGSVVDINLFPDKVSGKLQHFDAHWKNNPQIKTLAHLVDLVDPRAGNIIPASKMLWWFHTDKSVLYDPHMRETVVKNIVNFVKKYGLNGIDLDFAYTDPVNEHTKADKKNLVLLLKALRNEFNKADFILSVLVDPRTPGADMIYDIKGISEYANFINFASFSSSEPLYKKNIGSVHHTSPHSHSSNENVEEQKYYIHDFVKHWMDNGVPENKLILGITLNQLSPSDFDAPFTGKGHNSYPAVTRDCKMSKEFDVDPMEVKARYVKKMNLGGIVIYNLDQDDVLGKCGEKFAVLKALNRVLRNKC